MDKIQKLSDRIRLDLRLVEQSLRIHKKGYRIDGAVCMACGQTYPKPSPEHCNVCPEIESDLQPRYCTLDSRVSGLFVALRKVGLWPSDGLFQTCSVSHLFEQVCLVKIFLKHSCAAHDACPLHFEIGQLCAKWTTITSEVTGLELHPLDLAPVSGENEASD